MREEFLARRRHGRAAVTEGLARTARVITAAALIMVAVFGAFALSPDVSLKLIGVGLATAILVDATVVRMVLVPAVMQLLGDRNWWLPGWLDRADPRGRAGGTRARAAPAAMTELPHHARGAAWRTAASRAAWSGAATSEATANRGGFRRWASITMSTSGAPLARRRGEVDAPADVNAARRHGTPGRAALTADIAVNAARDCDPAGRAAFTRASRARHRQPGLSLDAPFDRALAALGVSARAT